MPTRTYRMCEENNIFHLLIAMKGHGRIVLIPVSNTIQRGRRGKMDEAPSKQRKRKSENVSKVKANEDTQEFYIQMLQEPKMLRYEALYQQ